jgi:hypothetical protein
MRFVALAVLLFFSLAADAHHSAASFDQSVEVFVEGTVTELVWANPHVYFSVASAGPGGERVVQQVEAAPLAGLMSWGRVTRESLHVGDRVRVRANPNRRGAGGIVRGLEVTTADGSVLALHPSAARSNGAPAATAAPSILGTWVAQPEGSLALVAAMRGWPLTQRARETLAGDRSDVAAANSECIPAGLPGIMVYPNAMILAALDGAVTFEIDWMGARRTVHLEEQHPVNVERTTFGHSVGHWDGGALLVDTVGFTAQPAGMGFAFPSSEAKHVVERFSLSDDRKHLEYRATAEDPVYLTAPVTVETRWDYRPGQALSGQPCDPAVARRFLSD